VARNSLTELLDKVESGDWPGSVPQQANAVRLEIARLTAEVDQLLQLCMKGQVSDESSSV